MKSIVFTLIQFLCLGIILLTNPWISGQPFLVLVQFAGLLLGVWAVIAMSKSKLNVTPVPRKGSVLVNTGPYSLLRHPMYSGIILFFFPMLYTNYGVMNLLVFGILLINLLLKLNYEEMLLRRQFNRYGELMETTWRLIPFVY